MKRNKKIYNNLIVYRIGDASMTYKKKMILMVGLLCSIMLFALASSYALFTFNVTKNTNFTMAIGSLELTITDTYTEDKFIMKKVVPMRDRDALEQDGYHFILENTGTIASFYTVYLDDIILEEGIDRLENEYVKINLYNEQTKQSHTRMFTELGEDKERILETGYLKPGEQISYVFRMWVDYEVGNEAQDKYFATQIRVVGQQENAVVYTEPILNGADPVLKEKLIPVTIDDDGTVKKADITEKWYSYEEKQWANAVILKNESKNYKNGETIPEEEIESYFVWIPKYSYQLWDLGNYDSVTELNEKQVHEIPIKFGTRDTMDEIEGECTTPMNDERTQGLAGASGNCKVGDYMTHPAFISFQANGLWVGKFETGYDGAGSTSEAQQNESDSSKIIIKPNVYSWRNITVGNAFETSYNYQRELDSHMMKNTEWGAVAYLQHSKYGSKESVRVNNNSAYITGYAATEEPTKGYNKEVSIPENRVEGTELNQDGDYTKRYNSETGYKAATTGNISGVYDMSGGAWEYVMGYTNQATKLGGDSGIQVLYPKFFESKEWQKYYDSYESTISIQYNNRILGDATGEMGPFGEELDLDNYTRYRNSWYKDYAFFVQSSDSWFNRGGIWTAGSTAGVFAFDNPNGKASSYYSFRIVLAPMK